jgi:hypothetical protein
MATDRKLAGTRLGKLTGLALEEITAKAMRAIDDSMAAAERARAKNDIQSLYAHVQVVKLLSEIKEIAKLARACKYEEDCEE